MLSFAPATEVFYASLSDSEYEESPPGFVDIDDAIGEIEKDPANAAQLAAGRKELIERLPDNAIMGLARLRLAQGMSQRQLADAVGTKQPQISRLESGLCDPQLSTLQKIASALGVSLEEVTAAILAQVGEKT